MLPPDLPSIPKREADSHKGTYGRLLLVGGSRGMAGSISLSAIAALRSGAGLVTVAVPDCIIDTVSSFHPCYMTFPLHEQPDGSIGKEARSQLETIVDQFDCIGVGPGLRNNSETQILVDWINQRCRMPVVFDADALNAISSLADLKFFYPRVLTPHPGEFKRLAKKSEASPERAIEFARQRQATIVLKGHRTIVTDGVSSFVNMTGNPGMATGGSGDVLTGIICAWIGQGLSPLDAAKLAVHVHGIAGDKAADVLGQISLTASDIADHLSAAYLSL